MKSKSGYIDLNNYIEKNKCTGLNVDGDSNVGGLFGGGVPVKSFEDDPELIINVFFNEKVNISHFLFEIGMNKKDVPELVKIFCNSGNIDFSDAEDLKGTEEINLENNFGKEIPVKIAKFTNVDNISFFFKSDTANFIQINNIKIFGCPKGGNINFSEMKKNPVT